MKKNKFKLKDNRSSDNKQAESVDLPDEKKEDEIVNEFFSQQPWTSNKENSRKLENNEISERFSLKNMEDIYRYLNTAL